MKKGLLFLTILFSLLVVSCSDDDNDSTKKIKQIENDIIGIWTPNPSNPVDFTPVVFYFNKDKTGSMHQIINVTNGIYELEELRTMKNIRIEEFDASSGHLHKLIFENQSDNKLGEYLIHYVSSDSLSIQFSKPEAFKKVSSINVK